MILDHYRGRDGWLGWLVMRWDVYQLRRFGRALQRARREVGR